MDKKISYAKAIDFVWKVLLLVAIPTTIFAWLGRWLDQTLHTSPWLTIASFFVSFALVFVLLLRAAKRFQKSS